MKLPKVLSSVALATLFVASLGLMTMPLSALAQPRHTADEIAKTKPSATFEVTAEQLRLLIGGATGKGTLYYQGKSYPFTIKAVTAGGVGATKVTAKGDVYFMERLEDFEGAYSAVTLGATLGAGAGGSQYENNKGVFLSVSSKSEGVGLMLGIGAVQVALVK